MKKLEEYVVSIPDFPEPGIIFRDITGILNDADGLRLAIDTLQKELEILRDRVSNPEYGEPQEVVVFISENENNRYAITPESMTMIGNMLFY